MSKTRRLAIPVSEDLYQRFTRNIPWGERTNIMVVLTEQLCELMEKEGLSGMALVYMGKVKLGASNEELSNDELTRAVERAFRYTKTQNRDED